MSVGTVYIAGLIFALPAAARGLGPINGAQFVLRTAFWAPTLGYLVLTLPADLAKAHLTTKQVSSLLKKGGIIAAKYFDGPGGVAYPHWTGETPDHLQIHINVLFPVCRTDGRGEVTKDVLAAARGEWTRYLNQMYGLKLETTDIHYTFSTADAKKGNKLNYVLRSTFTAKNFLAVSDADRLYYLSLKRFHKARWYGTLSNAKWKKYLLDNGKNPHQYTENDPHEVKTASLMACLLSMFDTLPGVPCRDCKDVGMMRIFFGIENRRRLRRPALLLLLQLAAW